MLYIKQPNVHVRKCFMQSVRILSNRCLHNITITNDKQTILDRLIEGDRTALAKAITYVESTRKDHRILAQAMLEQIANKKPSPNRANMHQSTFRIGISGPPGAGKSTFIESLGCYLVKKGHKIAVLTIDPTSTLTGGSILGDKTRMDVLSNEKNAFIRPSASRGTLGGVARHTNEAIELCEASGYEIILVETVGVGQSETMVNQIVDMFILVLPPAAGDELQGIKRGVMELAQLVIINKTDGDLLAAANRARNEITSAFHILRPASSHWSVKVVSVSSKLNKGIAKTWEIITKYRNIVMVTGELEALRKRQRLGQMWNNINTELLERFKSFTHVQPLLGPLEQQVLKGDTPPGKAADQLIAAFISQNLKD